VLVLEEVATAPDGATIASTCKALANDTFPAKSIGTMVWQLRKEGLLGMSDGGFLFLTEFGMTYLRTNDFTRAVPEYAERPKARRKKVVK
jgi:hypothetical protein